VSGYLLLAECRPNHLHQPLLHLGLIGHRLHQSRTTGGHGAHAIPNQRGRVNQQTRGNPLFQVMAAHIPQAFATIWHGAFSLEAGFGAFVGVIVQGFKRAAFSSEAGIGSAAIAHSVASVKYPVRQGMVALYEPFIDTIVICTMTALVIVITGVYQAPEYADLVANTHGAALTSAAFGSVVPWFASILTVSVILSAFSTMHRDDQRIGRGFAFFLKPFYVLLF